MKVRNTLATIGAGAGVFLVAFFLARTLGLGVNRNGYIPGAADDAGTQISLVFLFSSSCAACRDPELPELIDSAKVRLERLAGARDVGFHAMAVSSDPAPESGVAYLKGYGRFDEVSLGGGWRNNALLRYVWKDHAGAAEVPQVVLVRRDLIGPANGFFGVEAESVVGRHVGLGEIRRWVYGGAGLRQVVWE